LSTRLAGRALRSLLSLVALVSLVALLSLGSGRAGNHGDLPDGLLQLGDLILKLLQYRKELKLERELLIVKPGALVERQHVSVSSLDALLVVHQGACRIVEEELGRLEIVARAEEEHSLASGDGLWLDALALLLELVAAPLMGETTLSGACKPHSTEV